MSVGTDADFLQENGIPGFYVQLFIVEISAQVKNKNLW